MWCYGVVKAEFPAGPPTYGRRYPGAFQAKMSIMIMCKKAKCSPSLKQQQEQLQMEKK